MISLSLPRVLPRVRPATSADCAFLVKRINEGRASGMFRGGQPVSVPGLRQYQAELRRRNGYTCNIVELDGRPIGYLDLKQTRCTAELLGLYLDARARGQRFGTHLLRWATAWLRDKGCARVFADVHADNEPSCRACIAAGFVRSAGEDRLVPGHRLLRFRREIQPLLRVTPQESLYARLEGENLYLHHMALAEELAARFSELPSVDVVLGLGSLARSFSDEWSDLDVAVLGRGTTLNTLWRGEQFHAGLSIDLYVIDTAVAPLRTWTEPRRQAFAESVVLFSRNSRFVDRLREALPLRKEEVRTRAADCLLELGWMGYEPRKWLRRKTYGYLWELPPDLWIRRGCIASAHANADRALDMLLQLLFVLNGRLVPYCKWRRFLAPGLPWLPSGFSRCLARIDTAPRDHAGYFAREKHLLALVERTVAELERRCLLTRDIYASFVKRFPDYNS